MSDARSMPSLRSQAGCRTSHGHASGMGCSMEAMLDEWGMAAPWGCTTAWAARRVAGLGCSTKGAKGCSTAWAARRAAWKPRAARRAAWKPWATACQLNDLEHHAASQSTFPEAGVITLSLFSLMCSSACSLLSRFGEIAPNKDFISNSLFLKRHGPPVCEPVMQYQSKMIHIQNEFRLRCAKKSSTTIHFLTIQ